MREYVICINREDRMAISPGGDYDGPPMYRQFMGELLLKVAGTDADDATYKAGFAHGRLIAQRLWESLPEDWEPVP